jgi:TatD DNase family protein
MRWIDTHAHLDDRQFRSDLEAVLDRAAAAGVVRMVTVGADLASSRAAVALAERYPQLYATVGVHPYDAATVDGAALDEMRRLSQHPAVVAIGEIGLDYYRARGAPQEQRAAFAAQLELAATVDKPVVVHLRDGQGCSGAYDDALAMLRDWVSRPLVAGPKRTVLASNPGVLHCFSGDMETAQKALALGFCLGIDGPLTYPNARSLQALAAELPLERLVLETDCPYLAPQNRRGRRNEPAYLAYIGQKLAALKGITEDAVAERTTATTCRLFGWSELLAAEGGL